MKNSQIVKMKQHLMRQVDEWLGNSLPSEGSEDYLRWQQMLQEIEDAESVEQIREYLESKGIDAEEFFIDGSYDLIKAGVPPHMISKKVIECLAEEISVTEDQGTSFEKIYKYSGLYFSISNGVVTPLSANSAKIKSIKISQEQPCLRSNLLTKDEKPSVIGNREPIPLSNTKRPVILIIRNWPDGTMAFKLGSALLTALNVEKDDVSVLQVSPERIFKVNTSVSEDAFRSYLRERSLSNHDIRFFEV